jgi:nucleotidyltransferase/DNA polymerase involved in DNA repair
MATILFVALRGLYVSEHEGAVPPVVVYDRRRVIEVSPGERRIRAGTPLKEARLLLQGEGTWVEYEADRYLAARDRWMSRLLDHSEKIEACTPASAFVDLGGHPNPVEATSEVLRAVWRAAGLPVAGGLASARWLARLSARRCDEDALRLGLCPIEPVSDAAGWLSGQSVHRLTPADSVTRTRLERLGACTIGDVQRLGAGVLARQFGADGARLELAARGALPDPVIGDWPAGSHLHAIDLEGCDDELRLGMALRELAARGVARLIAEDRQPSRAVLRLTPEEGEALIAERAIKQTMTEASTLATLLRQMRQGLSVAGRLRRATLQLSGLREARPRQRALWTGGDRGAELPGAVLTRLRTAYGERSVALARDLPVARARLVLRAWEAVYGRA